MRKSIITLLVLCGLFFIFPQSHVNAAGIIPNINVTASIVPSGSNPQAIVDGNRSSIFSTNAAPPQWVALNFPIAHTVNKIILYPQLSTSGRIKVKIEANDTQGVWTSIATIDTIMYDNTAVIVPLLKPTANILKLRFTTLSGGGVVAWREIEAYDGSENISSLKSFGYYGVEPDSNWDEVYTLQNSNVSITAAPLDVNVIHSLLLKARSTNMPDYMNMFDIFFTGTKPAVLRSDWQSRWSQFKSYITGYEDALAGFYFDEPIFVNAISETDFLTVTATLKSAYPLKRILLIEYQTPLFNGTLTSSYIRDITDIGFDYYLSRQNDNETAWDNYLVLFSKLLAIAPNKKIWFVADGFADNSAQIPRWFDAFEKYLGLAMTTANAEGIVNFIWYPFGSYPIALNSVIIPGATYYNSEFRARHLSVGAAITKIASSPTPSPTPTNSPTPSPTPFTKVGDINGDGSVNILDYTLLANAFGTNNSASDLNHDGIVNILDYTILSNNFGT